jgi:hypothetical protein
LGFSPPRRQGSFKFPFPISDDIAKNFERLKSRRRIVGGKVKWMEKSFLILFCQLSDKLVKQSRLLFAWVKQSRLLFAYLTVTCLKFCWPLQHPLPMAKHILSNLRAFKTGSL